MTENGKFCENNGVKIYYEITRNRKSKFTAVFLHGLGGDLAALKEESHAFQMAGYSTIEIDLRGHGYSDRPGDADEYAFDHYVEDVNTIITSEKIAHPVLVGHCFGGMISILYAAKYAKKLKGLILIDTSYQPPMYGKIVRKSQLFVNLFVSFASFIPSLAKPKHRDYSQFKGKSDYQIKRILSDIMQTSIRSYLSICNHLCRYDATELLGKIECPTLVVVGSDDSIFPPDVSLEIAQQIKRSDFKLIHGANHIIHLNAPEDLNATMLEFMEELRVMKAAA